MQHADGPFKMVLSVSEGTNISHLLMEVVNQDRMEVYLNKPDEQQVLLHSVMLPFALASEDTYEFKVKFRAKLNELHVCLNIKKAEGTSGAPEIAAAGSTSDLAGDDRAEADKDAVNGLPSTGPSKITKAEGASGVPQTAGSTSDLAGDDGAKANSDAVSALPSTGPSRVQESSSSPSGSRPQATLEFEVRPSEGKGLGAFAVRAIGSGERILLELPLVSRRGTQDVESAVEQLTGADKKLFWSLSQAERHGDIPSASGIWSSNALPTGADEQDPVTDHTTIIGSVFALACRFNHACHPNCHVAWNANVGKQSVHALRDISVGEELTVSYLSGEVSRTRANRQSLLQERFSFCCDCATCELKGAALAECERRQNRIAGINARLKTWPADLVDLVEEKLKLMKDEGMPEVWGKASMLAAIVFCRSPEAKVRQGRRKALLWAKRGAQCMEKALGVDSKDYDMFQEQVVALGRKR